MDQNPSAESPRAPLVPIPRTGLRGPSGILLILMLGLAFITFGLSLCTWQVRSHAVMTALELFCAASAVLLTVYLWHVGKRAKGILPVLLLVAILASYVTGSFVPAATLISLISAITFGALALSIMTRTTMAWIPLLPVVAYLVMLSICRDPAVSSLCFLPLPAAWALSTGTRNAAARENGPTRVGVICLTSLALTATIAAIAALVLYRLLGSLEPTVLSDALESARGNIIDWIILQKDNLPSEYVDELQDFFSRETIEYMVNDVINLLPGCIIVIVNLIAAVSQLLLQASLVSFGCGASLSDRVRIFRMSAVSCVVFTISCLFSLIGGAETSTLWSTVAQNIYMILLPGIAFAGLLRVLGRMVGRRMGCGSALLALVAPLLLLVAPLLLAAFEIIGRLSAFLSSKFRPPEGDAP